MSLNAVGNFAITRQSASGAIQELDASIGDTSRKCRMHRGKKARGRGQSGLDGRLGVSLLVKLGAPNHVGIHVEARCALRIEDGQSRMRASDERCSAGRVREREMNSERRVGNTVIEQRNCKTAARVAWV